VLDHVSIPVRNLERAAAFYDAVLAPLGLVRRKVVSRAIGYGPSAQRAPGFWLLVRREIGAAEAGVGFHVSFSASTREAVDAFHAAAMEAGGKDAGAPGERPEYTQPFYGAFVFDLDGFKIEAVCRAQSTTPGAAA
jgi:predicted lactoylglutathione lyase